MILAETKDGKQRDPLLLAQLTLTAWELEQTPIAADNARGRATLLRSHARLQAEIEAAGDIVSGQRSRLRVHDDADEGVLLIHGSTGNPDDLNALADHLHNSGYHVLNLLLPGHGTGAGAVPTVKWKSCLNEVLLRYRILSRACRRVHVVGFSFGAALAVLLAGKEKPASLSLLSPALIPKVPFGTRLLLFFGLHRLPFLSRKVGWDMEVFEAMDKAKGQVGKLQLPIYAAHCADDLRIDPASLRHLQKKSRHKASRFRLYPQGGHMILQAHGTASLHGEVLQFMRSGAKQRS